MNLVETLAWLNSAILAIAALGQLPLLVIFLQAFRNNRSPGNTDPDAAKPDAQTHYEPYVRVILCLRGADPFLERCIESLIAQDYKNFEICIVLDSVEDEAYCVAQTAINRTTNCGHSPEVHIEVLTRIPEGCSLKCASLVHACNDLPEKVEAVALIDADTLPHRTWLRSLIAPLKDEQVGATTGNRWYMPADFSLASLQRYLWNTNAVVQMYCFQIPWGGTLAIRRRALKEAGLLKNWERALCEDTMTYAALKRVNAKLAFVPALMMPNQEDCEFWSMCRWIRRQLLVARLYHPRWGITALHGLGLAIPWLMAFVYATYSALTGSVGIAFVALLGPVVYLLLLLSAWPFLELQMTSTIAEQQERIRWISFRKILAIPFAAFVFEFVYPVILLSAIFAKRVTWRGIDYEIQSPFEIKRLNYHPYVGEQATTKSRQSI